MSDFKKQLGRKIKELRSSMKLTQEDFCNKIQIEIPTLSNIERGKSYPTLQTLKTIIDSFNIEPNEIFDFNYLIDEKDIDENIFKMYNSFSIKEKQYLYRLVKFIYDIK